MWHFRQNSIRMSILKQNVNRVTQPDNKITRRIPWGRPLFICLFVALNNILSTNIHSHTLAHAASSVGGYAFVTRHCFTWNHLRIAAVESVVSVQIMGCIIN